MKTYPGQYIGSNHGNNQSTSILLYDELPADRREYLESLEYSQGRKIDEVFLINLDRSKDRLARATDQLERANVSFTRFPAVLGYDLDIEYLDTGKVITGKELFETTIKTEPGHEYEVSYNHKDFG